LISYEDVDATAMMQINAVPIKSGAFNNHTGIPPKAREQTGKRRLEAI
jgi:hypothetical protein